jgi:peroxiredoxin
MTGLKVGDAFPDFTLPDHRGSPRTLSGYTRPSRMDQKMGYLDGYPIVVIFSRGFFCPRDQQQMRALVGFRDELKVNYCKLAVVNADPPMVAAAFRAALGANFPFFSDEDRTLIKRLGILDETDGEYAFRSRPFAFVLRPDLTVHRIYDGCFFVGRPTVEELRHDLRAIMESNANYAYEPFDTPKAKGIRIPQQEWLNGAPTLGANGLPVASGVVKCEGYRTIRPGTRVRFAIVEHRDTGPTARNVQRDPAPEVPTMKEES